jgi:hypothetical protein
LFSGIGIVNPRAARQRPPERFRHRFPRHIVISRSETSAEDQQFDARERRANQRHQLAAVVSDDGLEHHLDAQTIQLFGDEQ